MMTEAMRGLSRSDHDWFGKAASMTPAGGRVDVRAPGKSATFSAGDQPAEESTTWIFEPENFVGHGKALRVPRRSRCNVVVVDCGGATEQKGGITGHTVSKPPTGRA
jgi:hypothetical protein